MLQFKLMRLFFDARFIRTDFHDGVSRYTTELGNALAALTPVTFIISDKAQLQFLPDNAEYIEMHSTTSAKEPLSSLILNRYNPDVVVSPLQTMGSIGRKFKLVLTLHDMIYYKHRTPPPYLNAALKIGWRAYHLTYFPQRLTLNGADMIVTVSETSKTEILEAKLTKRPVVVVPNAARDLSALLTGQVSVTPAPKNLVYMGAFIPYKNAETLIRGMQWLPGRTLHLLSRISPSRRAQLAKLVPSGAQVVFHGGVSDEEYANLLADSAVLVSASKAEGYGLPVAEAQGMGVPAVVSDLDIFREVGGAGALYFDPDSPQDFADKVKQLDDPQTIKKLSEESKKQVQKFSWDRSAKTLLDAVKKL